MKKADKEIEEKVGFAFMQNLRTIKQIQNVMLEKREERVIDAKKEKTSLEKVVFPKGGGILTYLRGYKEPYRGFPYFEMVERVDDIKKISKKVFSRIYHDTKGIKRLKLLFLFPMLRTIINGFRYALWFHTSKFKMRIKRYSQPMREIYRVWNTLGDSEEIKEWRDIVCMILEFDNAYRYRVQDILSELNKETLKKNPLKEILRLMDLLIERELEEGVQNKWKEMRDLGGFYLRIARGLLSMVQEFLLEINLEEVKFSKEDLYFCVMRTDYDFGFCLRGERKCKLGAPEKRKKL